MNSEETVAPDMPQTQLTLRKLDDLLRENKITPEIEKQSGMSKEEMEQFVKKYLGTPKAQPGPGRVIDVKPGEQKNMDPRRPGPDFNPGDFSPSSERQAGQVVQDTDRNMAQGNRSEAPLEIKSRFEAFKDSLSRSTATRPAAPPRPPLHRPAAAANRPWLRPSIRALPSGLRTSRGNVRDDSSRGGFRISPAFAGQHP